jgi:hypothetical protein
MKFILFTSCFGPNEPEGKEIEFTASARNSKSAEFDCAKFDERRAKPDCLIKYTGRRQPVIRAPSNLTKESVSPVYEAPRNFLQ